MKIAKEKKLLDPRLINLIEGCVRGERRSQEKLYSMFKEKMRIVCKRYFKDQDSIEEVLQDSFIKVFKKIGDYRLNGSFEGWVQRIVRNTAIDLIRRHKNKFVLPSDDILFDLDRPDDSLGSEEWDDIVEKSDIVKKEMGKMTDKYKEAINLFVIEDKSHREIAVSLGIQEGTSKSNFFRAKAKINKTLREKYPDKFWVKN